MVKRNFTRKDLSERIHKNLGFSKNLSSRIVEDFFESIIHQIIKSEKIKITSFGTFSVLNRKRELVEILKQRFLLKFIREKLLSSNHH